MISCVALGGSGLPASTASPRATTPCSKRRRAASTCSGEIGGSADATDGSALLAAAGGDDALLVRLALFRGLSDLAIGTLQILNYGFYAGKTWRRRAKSGRPDSEQPLL